MKKKQQKPKFLWFKYLYFLLASASLGFLIILLGTAIMYFNKWPSAYLKDAYGAYVAYKLKISKMSRSIYEEKGFFLPARQKQSGILRYNKEKAYDGLTVFASAHDSKVFLISMNGDIVHEWNIPFSKYWPNPEHIEYTVSDKWIRVRKAYLYPNGDLLAILETPIDTPYGYGLVKVDKNSNLIWKYSHRAHHDVDVGADGKVYVLTHTIITDNNTLNVNIETPWLDDEIVVLSPDGKELQKISLVKALQQSPFNYALSLTNSWDKLHTNTIEVVEEDIAPKFPFVKPGQILVSFRDVAAGTIAFVDLETEKVVWAKKGMWAYQHDPDLLENGNILIFDNRGHFGEGGGSRIIEFEPDSMKIVWEYTGDKKDIFYSYHRASQQKLPNGNVLITESNNGRLFEVSPEKEIVWEYSNTFRSPDGKDVAAVFWAERFAPSQLNFEFNKAKK